MMSSKGQPLAAKIPLLTAAAALGISLTYILYKLNRDSNNEKERTRQSSSDKKELLIDEDAAGRRLLRHNTITIAYASTTGTCKNLALELVGQIVKTFGKDSKFLVQCLPMNEIDFWDEFLNPDEEDNGGKDDKLSAGSPALILVIPTWTDGTAPPSASNFFSAIDEIQTDWRVASYPLSSSKLHVTAFGMGSTEYDPLTFCKPVKNGISSLVKLGATELSCGIGMGDDAVGDYRKDVFEKWSRKCADELHKSLTTSSCSSIKEGTPCCSSSAEKNQDGCACADGITDERRDDDEDDESYISSDDDNSIEPDVMDLEDIGVTMKQQSKVDTKREPKEMVTIKQAAALKKEGYKLIGTHSAVKLCRWTKHQLRGRGGCYKHTFYGITSYQCMEATPSLACANKCVFCWRHHKNPVGKEWRWKTDDPKFIVKEAVETHVKMIKEAKGIPGVQLERWKEAHTVRHCALSLVGEPIMYPHIKELLNELHDRKISTFLVTNGQHPQAIETLNPITQLYVSVDASTPESLEAIDRPLFKDAWQRLRQSLISLKSKGQRTVARLTVVKGWNSDEIEGYAKLIALGHCSLVEVKGVTFCGKSDASNLNMSNTPWHHEVVQLTQNLQKELAKLRAKGGENAPPEYGLACEHKHSCSVLLARVDQFAVDDPTSGKRKWRTWIDYEKFQDLAARNKADPSFTFGVSDYIADTPSWAVFGAEEEGFDPTDKRHRRKKKHPKYTKFDHTGIPTHDENGKQLDETERKRLRALMEAKRAEIGDEVSVVTGKGGDSVVVNDASLMFRGLVVEK